MGGDPNALLQLRRRRLLALPKAELHLHLYGAMRRSTLAELCTAAGRAVPEFPTGRLADFAQFSDIFDAVKDCVASEADLRRLVREVVEDQAASGCSSGPTSASGARQRTATSKRSVGAPSRPENSEIKENTLHPQLYEIISIIKNEILMCTIQMTARK